MGADINTDTDMSISELNTVTDKDTSMNTDGYGHGDTNVEFRTWTSEFHESMDYSIMTFYSNYRRCDNYELSRYYDTSKFQTNCIKFKHFGKLLKFASVK
jgi:hypothetical protein